MSSSPARAAGPAQGRPGSPQPARRSTYAVVVAAVVVVLGLVVLVGWLSSRAGSLAPSANPATLPLALPTTAGTFQLDPNAKPSPAVMPLGEDQAQSITATYYEGSDRALLVMGVRPVADSNDLVAELDITAVRQVGDGLCGRYPTGQDVCVVRSSNVGVVGVGLANQSLEQVVEESTLIAQALVSQ